MKLEDLYGKRFPIVLPEGKLREVEQEHLKQAAFRRGKEVAQENILTILDSRRKVVSQELDRQQAEQNKAEESTRLMSSAMAAYLH